MSKQILCFRFIAATAFAPANLLVVFLLVGTYNLVREGSREILPRTRAADQAIPPEGWIQPGRYDFVWIFSAALAANRGWPSHFSQDAVSDSKGV